MGVLFSLHALAMCCEMDKIPKNWDMKQQAFFFFGLNMKQRALSVNLSHSKFRKAGLPPRHMNRLDL